MESTIHAPKKKYMRSMRLSQDSLNEIGSPSSQSDAPSPLSLPSVKMEDIRSPDSQFSLDFSIKSPLSVKSKLEFSDMLDFNLRSPPSVSQSDLQSPIPSPQVLNTPQMLNVVHSPRSGTRVLSTENRDDFEIKVPPKKLKGIKTTYTPERRSSLLKDSTDSRTIDLTKIHSIDDRESGYRSDSPRSSLADSSKAPASAESIPTFSPENSAPKSNESSVHALESKLTVLGDVQFPNITSNQVVQEPLVTQSIRRKETLWNNAYEIKAEKTESNTMEQPSQISPQLPSSTNAQLRPPVLSSNDRVTAEAVLYPQLRFTESKLRGQSPMMAGYQVNTGQPIQRLSPADIQHLPQADYDLHMFLQQEGNFLHPFPSSLMPFRPPGMIGSQGISAVQPSSTLSPPTGGTLRQLESNGRILNSNMPVSTQGMQQVSPNEHYHSPQSSRNYDMLKVPTIQRTPDSRMNYMDAGMSKQGDYPPNRSSDSLELMGMKPQLPGEPNMVSPNYVSSLSSPLDSTTHNRSFTAQLMPDNGYGTQPWPGGNKISGIMEAQSNSLRKEPVSSGTYPYLPQGHDNGNAQRRDYPMLPGSELLHPLVQGYQTGHTVDIRDLHSKMVADNGSGRVGSTSTSTLFFNQLDSTRCQVCNDNASGFHCGAYVCEACKKFFIRCQKNDSKTLLCPKNKDCIITKETRTQCQYCRYQKCIKIGMYKPGPGHNADINPDISGIPCKVCGAPSSGYHFGAITCEGCKGFFRRTVKERDSYSYQCVKDGNCIINLATRNMCKYCRYKKCLEAGMTPEGSRIGRQPNAVKHATMLQLQELQKTNNVVQKPIMMTSHDDDEEDMKPLLSELPPAPVEIPDEYREIQSSLLEAVNHLKEIGQRSPKVNYKITPESTFADIWKASMDQFGVSAHATLLFSKKVPGFRALPIEDRIALVQNAVYQIVLTMLSLDYDEVTGDYNYFNFTKDEEACIINMFPEYHILPKQFIYFGQTFKKMQMDEMEIAHFCALILLCLEQVKSDKELVGLQERIFISLQYYCQDKYGTETCRHGELLARLVELRRANIQHHQAVVQLKMAHPDLEIPQLYTEMYLND